MNGGDTFFLLIFVSKKNPYIQTYLKDRRTTLSPPIALRHKEIDIYNFLIKLHTYYKLDSGALACHLTNHRFQVPFVMRTECQSHSDSILHIAYFT